ncbi:MAG TPA: hypothetical protein PK069_01945 [Methanolinea sp.]|nr:hypothetical protein [Methanolinea sp.]HQK55048.1 hypothetical protein [Methanolinea sp.]
MDKYKYSRSRLFVSMAGTDRKDELDTWNEPHQVRCGEISRRYTAAIWENRA